MIIKICGERNTGTNYLMKLLATHFSIIAQAGSAFKITSSRPDVDFKQHGELGWKHRLVSADFFQKKNINREDILFVVMVKNPYSWLLSLHKSAYSPINERVGIFKRDANGRARVRPFLARCLTRCMKKFNRSTRLFFSRYPKWCVYEALDFSDFLHAKWFASVHEGCDEGFVNPIDIWNKKNRAYLELAKDYNVMLLSYEQLLDNPELILHKIADQLQCPMKSFENVQQFSKPNDRKQLKNTEYYRDYYLNERWRDKLSAADIAEVSSQLDSKVMQAFGYNYL